MDETRALLDQLMGRERDVPLDKRTNRARHFTDDVSQLAGETLALMLLLIDVLRHAALISCFMVNRALVDGIRVVLLWVM